jgi:hypothetical protein
MQTRPAPLASFMPHNYKQCQIAKMQFVIRDDTCKLTVKAQRYLSMFASSHMETHHRYRPITPVRTRPPSVADSSHLEHSAVTRSPCETRDAKPLSSNCKKMAAKAQQDMLPTPRQSLDGRSRNNLLDKVIKIISGDLNEDSLTHVGNDDFEWIRTKGEGGESPGWEGLK